MKAFIYDPYLDTLGGGERYILGLAKVLRENNWEVDLYWKDRQILTKLEERLGLKTEGVRVVRKFKRGKGYGLVFWLSDGSIPLLFGGKNILHFQTPFHGVAGRSPLTQVKLKRIHHIVCNSEFTKKWIDQEYGVYSKVVYPPVDVGKIKPLRKGNVILYVGRFSTLQQRKGQAVLIEAFQELCDEGFKEWKLVLVGGSDVGAGGLVDKLRERIKRYPVEIIENPAHAKLKTVYGQAKIFWSAAGFEIDEEEEPEKVEHFGISIVEAMSAGCVPVIVDKGGHQEIVSDKENGYLWGSIGDLKRATLKLAKDDQTRARIARKAQARAKTFSIQIFEAKMLGIIEG